MTNRRDAVAKAKERYLLVTTAHRGVFAGFCADSDAAIRAELKTEHPVIKLRDARCCIYWPTENQGFLGLAKFGPKNGARIGPPVSLELRDVTSVSECTEESRTAWESAKWTR